MKLHFYYSSLIMLVFALLTCAHAEMKSSLKLSPRSFAQPIKSCYRWININELNAWKKGQPFFTKTDPGFMGRTSKPTAYCWANTVGSLKGPPQNKPYGTYLLRIDLVDDAVIFNRNKNSYLRIDGQNKISKEMMKDIDSEVVYANYKYFYSDGSSFGEKSLDHFHEYYITSKKAIRSWSLGDKELKSLFSYEYNKIQKGQMKITDFLYFENASNEDNSFLGPLSEIKANMDDFWNNNSKDLVFENNDKRESLL